MSNTNIWTVLDVLKWTADYFRTKQIEGARLEAELMLAHLLKCPRINLYLNYDKPLSKDELAQFKAMIKRRAAREPLQYITGEAHFLDIKLKVTRDVLIPRPETELLVEKAKELIKNDHFSKVIDIGTGSGAIAISLAKYFPEKNIYASDISEKALVIARENADSIQVGERIDFQQGDLLGPWLERIDKAEQVLILANLPYVRVSEWPTLQEEVKAYEPEGALVSGADGIDHYLALFKQLKTVPFSYGLLLEMGIQQTEILKTAITKELSITKLDIIKDHADKERFIYLSK